VTKDKVKVIVVTDGERVLGLGDQGIGGMGIAIGKLSIYTACGGISPAYTLPVALDVGTNNQSLLDDPFYMGLRHPRIGKEEYDSFIDQFVDAAQALWPGVLIQFEDFAQPNAMPILRRHRERVCCFNDDIQGTAAVTLGCLLSACRMKGEQLREQTIVFVGAGSAGCGIAELTINAMISEGLSDAQARARVFMVDQYGLLVDGMTQLADFQQQLVQPQSALSDWTLTTDDEFPQVQDVIANARASILIGVSGKAGLFTEALVRRMHADCPRPVIMPLSNPSHHVEAHPGDILAWTNGQAIVATGSPFAAIEHEGNTYPIAQCNNSYVFPGIGLGVLACGASRVTDEMLMVASTTLAELSAAHEQWSGAVLPPLTALPQVSREVAFNIAKMAQAQGFARELTDEQLLANIERYFWTPAYREYRRVAMRAS
jgi:malate dehydrogenase (oxaloacetate-decarboxylating)